MATLATTKPKFYYAVARGYEVGIFDSWAQTHSVVNGYSGAVFKKFGVYEDAEFFLIQYSMQELKLGAQPSPKKTLQTLKPLTPSRPSLVVKTTPQICPDCERLQQEVKMMKMEMDFLKSTMIEIQTHLYSKD
jgi:viroplasmin and RNaseH domain-containing protein